MTKPVPKPKKKQKTSLLKQYANDAFSKYIRTRDAILTTGTIDEFVCISCGHRVPLKGNDCGHFVDGRKGAVLYHRHVANAQCGRCNRYLKGNYINYEKGMREKYGFDHTEELKKLKWEELKHTRADYVAIRAEYLEETASLIKRWEEGEFEITTSSLRD